MSEMGLGAGLAALAFWGFLAVVVVGGMWYSIREKEVKQQTLRSIIEHSGGMTDELAEQLIAMNGNDNLDRDLKVSG